MRGGRGVQSTGARHVLRGPSRGPAVIKFFFRDTRAEMLEKLRIRYVKTNQWRSREGMGGHVSPSKNSRPPSKERKLVLGKCQNVPPTDKYRKKLNVFHTCCLWVRTAAILSSISCSHYGFLHKLNQEQPFQCAYYRTEQFIFHQHYNTSAVFYKR